MCKGVSNVLIVFIGFNTIFTFCCNLRCGIKFLNKLYKGGADCIDFIFNEYAEAENNSNILLLADTF